MSKVYKAKHHYELPNPTNAHFQHDSCVGLEELPSKLVSHVYLIFRNKQDISNFEPLVTFGDFQQGFTNFLCLTWSEVISVTQLWQSCHPEVDTSEVMKQNIATGFPALQMHNSDMTVVSGSKSYPQSWCHIERSGCLPWKVGLFTDEKVCTPMEATGCRHLWVGVNAWLCECTWNLCIGTYVYHSDVIVVAI